MTILLDLNSGKSIYIQIAEIIENDILLGNLIKGEQTPSTNEFAKVYGINPATARKGLNILVDEGILYKKRGLGMFISKDAKRIILDKRRDIFFETILPDILEEANRLEIGWEDIVNYIEKNLGGERFV